VQAESYKHGGVGVFLPRPQAGHSPPYRLARGFFAQTIALFLGAVVIASGMAVVAAPGCTMGVSFADRSVAGRHPVTRCNERRSGSPSRTNASCRPAQYARTTSCSGP
jgi:hypothetical protein